MTRPRLLPGARMAARHGQDEAGAEIAVEPVMIEPDLEAVADQPRRCAVEDAANGEGAGPRHPGLGLDEVGAAPLGQGPERRALDGERLGHACIAPGDDVAHEAAIGLERVEVAVAPQHQRLIEGALEVPVGSLDRAVLMREAAVVARRGHAVVPAELAVAGGEVVLLLQVLEGGRQAVGAMLGGNAARLPERVLQPVCQGGEALAALDHLGMLPAREGEGEVVEPVLERQRRRSSP